MPVTISGTNGVTFNDSTTQSTAATAPTTDQVLSATAGASAGGLGTYAFMKRLSGTTTLAVGSTAAGSTLRYSSADGATAGASGIAEGTWRLMGYNSNISTASGAISLWLRIS